VIVHRRVSPGTRAYVTPDATAAMDAAIVGTNITRGVGTTPIFFSSGPSQPNCNALHLLTKAIARKDAAKNRRQNKVTSNV
jgi:hypothetical protein